MTGRPDRPADHEEVMPVEPQIVVNEIFGPT